jgi:membrane protein implicated in regulation of membrane protease activity
MSLETKLDVRLPIGVMFTLFGVIIAIYGMVSDPAIYQRCLDININLWWGLVMVAFGGVLLIMALRSARAKKKTENR